MPNIDRMATYLKNNSNAKVNISGYASPEGDANYNQKLSEKPAEAVKNSLVKECDIDESRIKAEGKGIGSVLGTPKYNRACICITE